jgi:hypothetical protein
VTGQRDALLRIEAPLLRLLAGGREAGASTDPLRARAEELGVTDGLAVRAMVEKAFPAGGPDGPVLGIWQRLSELIHGRTGSLNPPGPEFNLGVAQLGLGVLVAMIPARRGFDLAAQFLEIAQTLESARAAVAQGRSLGAEIRRQNVPGYLVEGRDFEGSGTREDPYRLLTGNAIDGYQPLLDKLEIRDAVRTTDVLDGYGVADKIAHADGETYIVPFRHP